MRRVALVLLLAGCAHAATPPNTMTGILISEDALAADSIAHAMVQHAVDADARHQTPDSLYLADAEIIANGVPRADAPRLAGVGDDGAIQLGSSRFSVSGSYVWGTIQYRWVPPATDKPMVDGWATFVMARLKTGGWRILHVHSSTAGPGT